MYIKLKQLKKYFNFIRFDFIFIYFSVKKKIEILIPIKLKDIFVKVRFEKQHIILK
jgi:hypothetical protein